MIRRRLSWVADLFLGGWAIVMVFPFIWMVSTSLKPSQEILQFPPSLLPNEPTLANYARVLDSVPLVRYFGNSVVVTAISVVCVVITSSTAGYVFGKHRFPGRDLIFMVFLASAILPLEAYMVPLYLVMKNWHWINTYQGLATPYLVFSFGVFVMRQFFRSTLPDELLDAARIDGASEWLIFLAIALPISVPAMAAVAILASILAWSAFIWPLIIGNSQNMFTMEVGLAFFQQRFTADYGALTAAATLSLLPMVVLFLIFRRYITESVVLTGFR